MSTPKLCGMGNPLLDIQAEFEKIFLIDLKNKVYEIFATVKNLENLRKF